MCQKRKKGSDCFCGEEFTRLVIGGKEELTLTAKAKKFREKYIPEDNDTESPCLSYFWNTTVGKICPYLILQLAFVPYLWVW